MILCDPLAIGSRPVPASLCGTHGFVVAEPFRVHGLEAGGAGENWAEIAHSPPGAPTNEGSTASRSESFWFKVQEGELESIRRRGASEPFGVHGLEVGGPGET